MRVKAKWNVKGSDGWHFGGEVFETEEDFGEAVVVLNAQAAKSARKPETKVEPVEKENPETEKEPMEEKKPEPAKEAPKAEKPKATPARRRTASK